MRWTTLAAPMAALLVAACATMPQPGYHPLTEVIAHRGASWDAPENTLAAFHLAADMGADWFELDCMFTADGEVIVIHDYDLERVAGSPHAVAELTLRQLQQFDVGSWKNQKYAGERLPTLRQSLALAKERGIGVYVEIKSVGNETGLIESIFEASNDATVLSPKLRREVGRMLDESGSRNVALARKSIEIIRELKMEKEVVIQSFQPIVCATVALEAPDIPIELLASEDPDHPERFERLLRWFYLFDLDGLNVHHETVTLTRLAMVQAAGKRMAVWTVNDPETMRRLAHWGVDAIITDRPDVCLEVLKEAGRRRSP